MKNGALAVLLLVLAALRSEGADPGWDKKKAAARLDERAQGWMQAATAHTDRRQRQGGMPELSHLRALRPRPAGAPPGVDPKRHRRWTAS